MAWLFIDTATAGEFRCGTVDVHASRIRTVKGRVRGLLVMLDRLFPKKDLSRLDGICVVHGPGSFSSVRGGVLVANLLARLFRKLLVGVSVDEANDLGRLAANLGTKRLSPSAYVMPTYDQEPNITMSSCPR